MACGRDPDGALASESSGSPPPRRASSAALNRRYAPAATRMATLRAQSGLSCVLRSFAGVPGTPVRSHGQWWTGF